MNWRGTLLLDGHSLFGGLFGNYEKERDIKPYNIRLIKCIVHLIIREYNIRV